MATAPTEVTIVPNSAAQISKAKTSHDEKKAMEVFVDRKNPNVAEVLPSSTNNLSKGEPVNSSAPSKGTATCDQIDRARTEPSIEASASKTNIINNRDKPPVDSVPRDSSFPTIDSRRNDIRMFGIPPSAKKVTDVGHGKIAHLPAPALNLDPAYSETTVNPQNTKLSSVAEVINEREYPNTMPKLSNEDHRNDENDNDNEWVQILKTNRNKQSYVETDTNIRGSSHREISLSEDPRSEDNDDNISQISAETIERKLVLRSAFIPMTISPSNSTSSISNSKCSMLKDVKVFRKNKIKRVDPMINAIIQVQDMEKVLPKESERERQVGRETDICNEIFIVVMCLI